jgi:hypothetical protein
MFSWSGKGLDIGLNMGSPLLWEEAGWSVASAFGIFAALRTGLPAFAFAAAAVSLWAWTQSRRHYRAIDDIPTARLSSAPQGQVELSGRGEILPEYPVVSPLTSLPCLWFDFKVEEGQGKQRRIVRQGTSDMPFALRDGGQSAMVLPEGARVISRHSQTWRRGDETYTESVLLKDEPLYVLGEYVHDWVESNGHSLDKQAGSLLQEWKDDQHALKARFDDDGNGVIDMHEWETARRQAQQDVMSGRQLPLDTAKQCIRKPSFGGPFIISNYSAQQLANRFRRWSWLHLAVSLMALAVAAKV